MSITLNPFIDNLDFLGSGVYIIPELTSDPVAPYTNQAWVLYTNGGGGSGGGSPLGLLLALTSAGSGGSSLYQLSYYTSEGTIVRATLS